MRTFQPESAPQKRPGQSVDDWARELVDWGNRFAQNVQQAAYADTDGIRWELLASAPSKTTEGDSIIADGDNYDPSDGWGLYVYRSSTWNKIGPTTAVAPYAGRAAKTGAYTVVAADKGKLIDATSGTWTLSLTAAATLADKHFFYFRNSGTGDITIDPNGSEQIDGLTSFISYPGEVRLIVCDGSAFYSLVLAGFSRTFTADGTFTKPPGYVRFFGHGWGAGGSGGRDATGTAANKQCGGGGGGGCVPFDLPASSFGATENITVGAGGAAKTTDGAGNVGGNSTIGSLITFYGGGPGAGADSPIGGGGGGALGAGDGAGNGGGPNGGDTSNKNRDGFAGAGGGNGSAGGAAGFGGGGGAGSSASSAVAGGASVWGGGGGGGPGNGSGGASKQGGNGGAGSSSGNATAGSAPGGGGGASGSGDSGAGARGEIRINGAY